MDGERSTGGSLMLCLSAKAVSNGGETIVFRTAHGEISIIIADAQSGRVRLGITAPAAVKIVRVKQVLQQVQQEVVA
jgi:sRNA-binding carbon storage regulator CsrA